MIYLYIAYACIKLVFAAYMLRTKNLKVFAKTGLLAKRITCKSGAICISLSTGFIMQELRKSIPFCWSSTKHISSSSHQNVTYSLT